METWLMQLFIGIDYVGPPVPWTKVSILEAHIPVRHLDVCNDELLLSADKRLCKDALLVQFYALLTTFITPEYEDSLS
ncbi:hypothetical protein BTVI_128717 [Pitangus sulphuratus]|nr:hypothetical protein BTVI_128717 [Pitangus sulphuratus]